MAPNPPDAAARLLARSSNGRRPRVMYHRWETLLFLHWRMPAERIQQTLPPDLTVDTFQGDAYLGIVPFFMRDVRPIGVPTVPSLSNFHELNVRTYAYDQHGTPGVWFYSLSCDQPLAVYAARLLTGLRYMHARMWATAGESVDYSCRRRGSEATARYRYRAVGPARISDAGSLEFFLLERYYLFATRAGSLVRGQVAHQPYEFRDADLEHWSPVPAHEDGFGEVTGEPVHVCAVDRLDVDIYATERLR